MAVVVLLDPEAAIGLQVQWATWFARARREALTLLVPSARREVATAQVAAALAAHDDFVFVGDGDEHGDDTTAGDGGRLRCRAWSVDDGDPAAVVQKAHAALPNLFVVLLLRLDAKDARAGAVGRDVLPMVGCAAAVVRLGDAERWPLPHLMVAASRGAHPRAALRLARALADVVDGGRLTGAYVEPDIGSDAAHVGEFVLGRVLRGALERPDDVRRHVVIDDAVDAGLARACADVQPDAVVMALPRPGLLAARFWGLVPARLSRRVDLPVIVLREPLPIGNRLRRGLESLLQRFVPQVERETRVELATRVQSSSAWNFDFVALISLATLIAALGLLVDSAAVIIGAMLIAPLMTPILGVGLSLAQGNVLLLRMALRSISYGVGTAFVLATLVGLVEGCTHPSAVVSDEMLARGWPGLIDLLIAFASGLAAAYAHSRPSLVAALPGVAIAAALVPPIATSGLAFAGGQWQLAYGAFLLFFTNMVAIVLAAGFSLWCVGVRKQDDKADAALRHLGNGLIALVVVLAVYLTQRPHVGASILLPDDVRGLVAERLPAPLRLVELRARRGDGDVLVVVRVGGPAPPPPALAAELRALVAPHVDGPVRLRVGYEWQAEAAPPDDGR